LVQVALPFGLGTVAVRTFFNENDLEETETGSQTAGAHYLEDEAEALQAAAMPAAVGAGDVRRKSEGKQRRNGNRLSLDVKERIQGISRRVSEEMPSLTIFAHSCLSCGCLTYAYMCIAIGAPLLSPTRTVHLTQFHILCNYTREFFFTVFA
jgi:hypothetical protein